MPKGVEHATPAAKWGQTKLVTVELGLSRRTDEGRTTAVSNITKVH